MKVITLRILALVTLLSSACLAQATGYSQIYVFGDSLSDTGNLKAVLQNPQIPERFTNGPVTVEIVANALGLSLSNSYHLLGGALPFGNNYAIAGAKAVDDDNNEATPDINLPTQVNAFLQIHGGTAPADALYIVFIGGNDIRAARSIRANAVFATGDTLDAAKEAAKASIEASVVSQSAQIQKLIGAGAQNILVAGAPDIGTIPETAILTATLVNSATSKSLAKKATKLPAITSQLSDLYNRKLSRSLRSIEHSSDLDLIEYDLIEFSETELENAAANGYTNVEDPCIYVYSQAGTPNPECIASAPNFPTELTFFYWDEIHPTALVHYHSALEMLETIQAH